MVTINPINAFETNVLAPTSAFAAVREKLQFVPTKRNNEFSSIQHWDEKFEWIESTSEPRFGKKTNRKRSNRKHHFEPKRNETNLPHRAWLRLKECRNDVCRSTRNQLCITVDLVAVFGAKLFAKRDGAYVANGCNLKSAG